MSKTVATKAALMGTKSLTPEQQVEWLRTLIPHYRGHLDNIIRLKSYSRLTYPMRQDLNTAMRNVNHTQQCIDQVLKGIDPTDSAAILSGQRENTHPFDDDTPF